MPAGIKMCTGCKEEKSLDKFHRKGDRLRSKCKECRSVEEKEYRLRVNTPERRALDNEKARLRRERFPENTWKTVLKHQYNISPEQWQQLLDNQDNCCAICRSTDPGRGRRFAVDHDHNCCSGNKSCGQCVRGLLCHYCNLMLGTAKDNLDRLWSAINYLMDWEKKNASR